MRSANRATDTDRDKVYGDVDWPAAHRTGLRWWSRPEDMVRHFRQLGHALRHAHPRMAALAILAADLNEDTPLRGWP